MGIAVGLLDLWELFSAEFRSLELQMIFSWIQLRPSMPYTLGGCRIWSWLKWGVCGTRVGLENFENDFSEIMGFIWLCRKTYLTKLYTCKSWFNSWTLFRIFCKRVFQKDQYQSWTELKWMLLKWYLKNNKLFIAKYHWHFLNHKLEWIVNLALKWWYHKWFF